MLRRLLGTRVIATRASSTAAGAATGSSSISGRTLIIPKLQTFYSANPAHDNNINRLEELLRKYIKLPSQHELLKTHGGASGAAGAAPEASLGPGAQSSRPLWLSFRDYTLVGGGSRLKPTQYTELVFLLNKLQSIDPQLLNDEVKAELARYRRPAAAQSGAARVPQLDEFGRSVGIGRRKAATAKAYVVRGDGHALVNNRQLNDYFVKIKDREAVLHPLQVLDAVGKYNLFITTSGGGPTGQADAAALAVGKALVAFNPLLKSRLHSAGCLTTDYRHVERKKPGKLKARKAPTWVKR